MSVIPLPWTAALFCLMSLDQSQNFWNLHYAGIHTEWFSQKINACLPSSLMVDIIRAQREEKLFWGPRISTSTVECWHGVFWIDDSPQQKQKSRLRDLTSENSLVWPMKVRGMSVLKYFLSEQLVIWVRIIKIFLNNNFICHEKFITKSFLLLCLHVLTNLFYFQFSV